MFEFDGIVAGYSEGSVLHGVSFAVPPASVVALVGPNGAGKTTLLRVASGLLTPRAGVIRYGGADLTRLRPDQRAALGICHIPEGRAIFRDLTVRQNLTLFAEPGHEAEAVSRATEAFPRLGERLNQVASTLSGGEQQMLALTRTYLRSHEIVLLDEVSLGLAPVIVDEVFRFIERLASTGTSVLLVEQYVERAFALARYVVVLAQGKVEFYGEPTELGHGEIFARYLGAESVRN